MFFRRLQFLHHAAPAEYRQPAIRCLRLRSLLFACVVTTSATQAELNQVVDTDGIRIVLSVQQENPHVGESVNVMLRVTCPGQIRAEIPEIGGTWGDFDVLGSDPPEVEPGQDGTTIYVRRFQLAATGVGSQILDEVPIRMTSANTGSQQVIAANEPDIRYVDSGRLSVPVRSVLDEPPASFASIRLPDPTDQAPSSSYLSITGLGLSAAAVAGLLYYFVRSRQSPKPVEDPIPEAKRRLGEWNAERGEGSVTPAQVTQLADIIRTCIGRKRALPPGKRTTEDLVNLLSDPAHPDRELLGCVRRFLQTCDGICFGGIPADSIASRELPQQAEEIISGFIDNVAVAPASIAEDQ